MASAGLRVQGLLTAYGCKSCSVLVPDEGGFGLCWASLRANFQTRVDSQGDGQASGPTYNTTRSSESCSSSDTRQHTQTPGTLQTPACLWCFCTSRSRSRTISLSHLVCRSSAFLVQCVRPPQKLSRDSRLTVDLPMMMKLDVAPVQKPDKKYFSKQLHVVV